MADPGQSGLDRSSLTENRVYPKKKSYRYRERDEAQRAEFLMFLRSYAKERMVYIDETGIDNTLDYPYGYCHHSERFPGERLGHRTERISLISGWHEGQFLVPMTFEGYCNSNLVCQWVETFLVPELVPGQFVMFDNASFHPKERIRLLVQQAHCEVIFLPTYSPDLNKIETCWAQIKNHVRKCLSAGQSLADAVQEAFRIAS
jgi:transposase